MRVFISSTCYDLIDVRAEIAEQLRQIGITPVLSDDKLSDFKVQPDVNSIETCLINVESCDEFILILDRRYGPSLKDCGFDDFSATHLEYKRALEKKIPVRVYVRDRLIADYSIWKRNGKDSNLKYSWVLEKKDRRLFNFLEEYSKLQVDSENSNFYETFTNSIDLKAAITKCFEKKILPKRLAIAIQNNAFPIINVKVETEDQPDNSLNIEVNIKNVSNAPAFNFFAYWEEAGKGSEGSRLFTSNESIPMVVTWIPGYKYYEFEKFLIVEYQSLLGVSVYDRFLIRAKFINSNKTILTRGILNERRYFRASDIEIKIEDL